MADSAKLANPLRVLVSEGNSTSAREAITILGLSGHIVEVCDPSFYCLARFSHFVRRFHRGPGLRDDPAGFLSFFANLLATRHFDVLLPIHEQGFLFACARQRLADRVELALPSFGSYRIAHSKAGFSRLPDQLGLPQPATRLDAISAVPLVLIAVTLLAAPKLAVPLVRSGWGAHLLDLGSIRRISEGDFL
jgi:hypothetical protein